MDGEKVIHGDKSTQNRNTSEFAESSLPEGALGM